ncbi:MAG TPA: response regulator [Caulobacteraceae bacterium]|nr:response regulator [Caulobacteraceae bacterium]
MLQGSLADEASQAVPDDRDAILPEESVVLIVEDDPRFASVLLTLVRDSGFKGVVTGEGAAVPGLARRFGPDAIMLDIGLPDMDGLALLDLLKHTPETSHIPVHVISADDQRGLGLAMGAIGFTRKPVERETVVSTLQTMKSFVDDSDRRIALVGAAGEAASVLEDCFGAVTIGPALGPLLAREPGIAAVVIEASAAPVSQTLDELRQQANGFAPALVYTPGELDPEDERRLRLGVFAGLVRLARNPDQLVEQVSLLLHEPLTRMSDAAKATLARSRRLDQILAGRKVLVIDDDIRNIFSLASALEEYGIELLYAESGRLGLDLLDAKGDVDLILVDIMMPDMDGYETIRAIRGREAFEATPVIAVTAKAMKGDRQKCIQAGASDYVAKPVAIDHLVSVLRVSLQRADARRLTGDALTGMALQPG